MNKPKDFSRRAAGMKAKINGEIFEKKIIATAFKKGWHIVRIPDGCRVVGKNTIIRVKSPFDFFMVKDGVAIFFDAKKTELDRFPHNKINQAQLTNLYQISNNKFKAGYIIEFGDGEVKFADAVKLKELKRSKSLHKDDLEEVPW